MQHGETRQTLVTLGPFYLDRRDRGAAPLSVGITTAVQFVGITTDLRNAAALLRARLAQLAASEGLDDCELTDVAQRVFDSLTDAAWRDRNGLPVAQHLQLRQLNVVTSDSAADAPSPVTVVTVSR